ncbi:MAG: porin [Caldimonas sp.]
MKRALCTFAFAAAAALPSSAQTVAVYGLIDVAVEHVSNVGASGHGLYRMPSVTGSLPSRIGFRANEDLGDGLRAVAVVEQGFAPDGGTFTQGGRAFGRQSYVGFTGPWGNVAVGRQYTMLYWSILDADILGTNLYGSGSIDAYIPNARADNAITYRGTFAGLTLGATYSLGRDSVNAGSPAGTNCPGEQAGDLKNCREWSALAKYDSPGWGAALAVDEIRGGAGAFAGLASSAMKDTRVSANGYANVGTLRLAAGLVRRDNDASAATPRSDLWYAGALYALTPVLKFDGEWFRLAFKGSSDRATLIAARATYSLSPRTAVYATLGHIANRGGLALSVSGGAGGSNPLPGTAQSGIGAGLRHSF